MSFTQCVFCRVRNANLPPLSSILRTNKLSYRNYGIKLHCIGNLQEPNHETDAYKPGQIFMHKTFSYRGVILHPWQARLYDKDKSKQRDITNISETDESSAVSQSKHRLYYQVLVDIRDIPHIRIENPCASYLQKKESTQIIVRPGIDYVCHEDILPFTSTLKAKPIQHQWFDKFLAPDPESTEPAYVAREDLAAFQEKNHSWLCLSKVYRETTENIRVTVIPFYMGKVDYYHQFWWRYCIRLENLGNDPVQLRERFLLIHSTPVSYEKLKARGVVGKEPKLTLKCPDFQYNSHVSLESDSGFMKGTYTMERPDGSMFEIKIPVVNFEKTDDLNNDHEDDVSG